MVLKNNFSLPMYNIIFTPLLGGQFVAQILSIMLNNNKKWLYNNKEIFLLYDNIKDTWQEREFWIDIDPQIKIIVSSHLTFKEIENIENLIFISCNIEKDLEIIKDRNTYIKTSSHRDLTLFNLRIKYHRELFNYLAKRRKWFFNIEFNHLWNTELFIERMKDLKKHFNIDINENLLQTLHKKWILSNLKIKQKKELK